MELKVYNGEYFERGKNRYLVFSVIILLIIVLSILSKNIVGGIFILIITGGYIFYLTKINNITTITTGERSLQIGNTSISWNNLSGFVLEYHTKKEKIHNIVIIDNKNVSRIFTIIDNEENLKNFVKELNNHIPILETYEQNTIDKMIRKLKL